jgi:hypothetical protein
MVGVRGGLWILRHRCILSSEEDDVNPVHASYPPRTDRCRPHLPRIGHVFLVFTMRAQGAIQAWQQNWPRMLADSARQRGGRLTWDQ